MNPSEYREKIINELTRGTNKRTKRIFLLAEKICREAYEKAYNYDLDLEFGHTKNLIPFTTTEELKHKLFDKTTFWMSLKEKYKKEKPNSELTEAIIHWCNLQLGGLTKLLMTL